GGASGTGGAGDADQGGTDLEQIAGAILPSDYPRYLREAGIGGRVGILFTVGPNGRVTRCTVTRSSGGAELDALTCRLIEQCLPTLPLIRASCHLHMPTFFASQTMSAPNAAAATPPTTGTTSRIASSPTGRRIPGITNSRSSSFSIASTRCRTDCGSVPTAG